MKYFIAAMCLSLSLALSGCFQSEEESALELVKNGYLDANKSATVGQMIEGYSYFDIVNWQYFKTDQGQKIVQATNTIDVWNNPKRYTPDPSFQTEDFLHFAKDFGLKFEHIIQFTLLPDDRFQLLFQGYRVKVSPEHMDGMPSNMAYLINTSEAANEKLLQSIYTNKSIGFPYRIWSIFDAYKDEERSRKSPYHRNWTDQAVARAAAYHAMKQVIPNNELPNFTRALHYTRKEGGTLMLFQDADQSWYGVVDTSDERSACSLAGEFRKIEIGFSLNKTFSDNGNANDNTCRMMLDQMGKSYTDITSNCHEQLCGMNGSFDGDYKLDAAFKVTIGERRRQTDKGVVSCQDYRLQYTKVDQR